MEHEHFCSLALPRFLANWAHCHAAFVMECTSKLSANKSCVPAPHFSWVCQTDIPCSLEAQAPLVLHILNHQIYCMCTVPLIQRLTALGFAMHRLISQRNMSAMHALSHFNNDALSSAFYHMLHKKKG